MRLADSVFLSIEYAPVTDVLMPVLNCPPRQKSLHHSHSSKTHTGYGFDSVQSGSVKIGTMGQFGTGLNNNTMAVFYHAKVSIWHILQNNNGDKMNKYRSDVYFSLGCRNLHLSKMDVRC